MNPQPLCQHSGCGPYRCGYTPPSPCHVTTKQGTKIKSCFPHCHYHESQPWGFSLETEKKELNKDNHKVIGHNCKWFSIWLCSGGSGGGGRIAVLGNWSGWGGTACFLGCRGPELKPFFLGTDELVFDGPNSLQIIANCSDFQSLWICNSFCSI